MSDVSPKPVVWAGSSLQDLQSFPREVQRTMGYTLRFAQHGGKHPDAKPLKGFGGAGVLEVVEEYEIDLIRGRLKQAEEVHRRRKEASKEGEA